MNLWVSLVISLLLSVGAVILLQLDRVITGSAVKQVKKNVKEKIRSRKVGRHISLKKQIELMSGRKRQNFIARNFTEAVTLLQENHEEQRVRGVYILSTICGIIGLIVSFAFENYFLIAPLVLGGFMIPSWVVKLSASGRKKQLNNELEVALSGVTTSYIRSDNLISAVEENLVYMDGIVKREFTKFVNENKLINSNIFLGIQKLSRSIDNVTFHEWCDAMYQCQSDRTLKAALFPIINRFSETKSIQAELDTLMMMPFKDTILMVMIVILSIPMMYLLSPEWYAVLTQTIPGQIILSLVAFAIIFSVNKAVSLTKPIRYGDD